MKQITRARIAQLEHILKHKEVYRRQFQQPVIKRDKSNKKLTYIRF